MKKCVQLVLLAGMMMSAACLTGCMNGETFDEFKAQLFSNDPMVLQVIPPNDITVDERGLEYAKEVQKTIEERKNFKCDVKLIPSMRLPSFIRNNAVRQEFAKTTSTRIFAGFNALSDFNFVGNELESLETLPEAASFAKSENYSLVFDIVNLSLDEERGGSLSLKLNNVSTVTGPTYCGSTDVALTLLDPEGKQRLYMHVKPSVSGCASYNDARDALADAAVQMLLTEYARQLAPPAAVDEVRGNGLFARINVGGAYGIQVGSIIRFVEQEMVKNRITEVEEFRQTQVADGVVKMVGSDYAWVKINKFHFRRVHIGTLVMK
ncbi:MAG: hypothetical protein IJT83_01925 [Victivallales bacterium]|nr:hypothetical protein [Victivallales bacterium]